MSKPTPLAWLLALAVTAVPLSRVAVAAEAADPAQAGKDPKESKKSKESKADSEMPVYGETVVVTASRTEERIADAPVSITVISAEQLATAPGDNYADVLRGVPGLNVVQFSARDVNFASRGATSSLSTGQLALLDGRSVYQDFFGFVAWDFLPVSFDEVKSIEVLRGPGSAIWGANALNGVINVRTKSPREMVGGELSFGGGEVGTAHGSARWADVINDQWSYKVSSSYFVQDPWDRPATAPSGIPLPAFRNEGTRQPKFDARFDYEPHPDTRWSYSAGGGYTTGLIHSGIGPFSVDSGTGVTYGKVSYTHGGLDLSGFLNHLDGDGLNLLNGIDFAFKNTTLSGEGTYRHPLGEKQALVLGGTARFNRFDLSIAPLEDHRNEVGAFLEDQVRIDEHFQFNLGGRLDWFDTIGTVFSPRTSLIVKPHPDHSIRLAYNRAYRAPSLVNNFLDTAVPNRILLPPPVGQPFTFLTAATGNPDLDEERVDAFEVGYTVSLRQRATLTAAVYRNQTRNNIDFFPSAFYSPADPPAGWPLPPAFVPVGQLPKSFSYRNIAKVIQKGVELSADVRVAAGVQLTASYAYQDTPEVRDNDPLVPLETNIPPENQFSATLSVVRGIWFGSLGLSYTDRALWTDVLDQRFWGYTDSYTLVNASLGVNLAGDRVQLAFRGTNLGDEKAQQHVFGDIIRRKVTGEVRLRFGGGK